MTDRPEPIRDAIFLGIRRVKFMVGALRHYGSLVLHKAWVAYWILRYVHSPMTNDTDGLVWRAVIHDLSKLRWREAKGFARTIFDLKNATYGSAEYKALLEQIKPSIAAHYRSNRHHPEHHRNGFRDMTDIDKIEMVADWAAATRRMSDGDLGRSIEHNRTRFGYSDEDADELIRIAVIMGAL